MRIIDVEQNSEQWFKEKQGKPSGSRVKGIISDKILNRTDVIKELLKYVEDDAIGAAESIEDEKDKKKFIKSEIDKAKKSYQKLNQRQIEHLAPKDMYLDAFEKSQKKEYFRLMAEQLGYSDDELEDPRDRGHRLEPEAADHFSKEYNLSLKEVGICVRDDNSKIIVSPDRLVVEIIDGVEVIKAGLEIKSMGVVNHLELWKKRRIPSDYFWQIVQYFVVIEEVDLVYFISYNPIVKECPMVVLEVHREDLEYFIDKSLSDQELTLELIQGDIDKLTF